MTKPSEKTTRSIKNWLIANGVASTNIENATPNGDFLRVRTNIGFAESLFQCHYYDYTNTKYPNISVSRVDNEQDYLVPSEIVQHLDFISPTKRFPSPMRINSTYHHPAAPENIYVTPEVLEELYSVENSSGRASNNIQAVASFLEFYYSQQDLLTFWQRYDIPNANVTNVPSNESTGHGAEAELDVQYLTAMGRKIPTQVWYTPGRAPNNPENEPFLTWLLNVESASNPPLLFSVSYGEDEKSVGYSYASRINTEFAKLGATGMSFLFASGDYGAGGNCTASGGRECPNFPTGSPYVTSVGGTEGTYPEIAWGSSGGGFSDYWPTQPWQKDAVQQYFITAKDTLPPASKYNQSGRGYPDVSAQSEGFIIIDRGIPTSVSGTSCSAPTVSGIFALLNDLRLQHNMAPLGFLNPFIYETVAKDSTILTDITQGINEGCRGDAFPAVVGWDAVTGYGTPNYAKLAQYVLQTGAKTIRDKQ